MEKPNLKNNPVQNIHNLRICKHTTFLNFFDIYDEEENYNSM